MSERRLSSENLFSEDMRKKGILGVVGGVPQNYYDHPARDRLEFITTEIIGRRVSVVGAVGFIGYAFVPDYLVDWYRNEKNEEERHVRAIDNSTVT